MGKRSLVPDAVEAYVNATAARETPLQQRLRAETAALPRWRMQIGPDQGALLAFLVRPDRATVELDAVSEKLVDVHTGLAAARALMYETAWRYDQGANGAGPAAAVKLVAAETTLRAALALLQQQLQNLFESKT